MTNFLCVDDVSNDQVQGTTSSTAFERLHQKRKLLPGENPHSSGNAACECSPVISKPASADDKSVPPVAQISLQVLKPLFRNGELTATLIIAGRNSEVFQTFYQRLPVLECRDRQLSKLGVSSKSLFFLENLMQLL